MESLFCLLSIDVFDAKQHQCPCPVEGFAHRWCLLQIQLTNASHDTCDLVGKVLRDVGNLREDNFFFAFHIWVIDVQEQATALECFGQFACVVRREEDHRNLLRRDSSKFWNRNLVLRENLEQQCLCLNFDAVYFVNQENYWILTADRLKQRTGEQKFLGENVVVNFAPRVA